MKYKTNDKVIDRNQNQLPDGGVVINVYPHYLFPYFVRCYRTQRIKVFSGDQLVPNTGNLKIFRNDLEENDLREAS